MLIKAVGLAAVDCSGRMLAPGETADLDPSDPVIADHIDAGRLALVQGVQAARVSRQKQPAIEES